jgi:hypothetical protein
MSLLHTTKRDQIIQQLVKDICASKKTDMVREKIVDAILAFDQKDPHNLPALCEALQIALYDKKTQSKALAQIIRLITDLQTLTLSKRIHIKKILCLIN